VTFAKSYRAYLSGWRLATEEDAGIVGFKRLEAAIK